jgi:hypothetical protein
MDRMPRRAFVAAGMLGAVAGWRPSASLAQLPGTRVRGRIVSVEGDVLTVAVREGGQVMLRLGEAPIAVLRRVSLEELAPGTPLGVVAEPAGDGLRAVAVTVLPPTATRQFQSPWDLGENTSMNNGAVAGVMQRADGQELTLSINGRAVPMRIDGRTALVRPVAASREDLRPGAAVFVTATRGEDGRLTATRVTVEKDGVAPPT